MVEFLTGLAIILGVLAFKLFLVPILADKRWETIREIALEAVKAIEQETKRPEIETPEQKEARQKEMKQNAMDAAKKIAEIRKTKLPSDEVLGLIIEGAVGVINFLKK